MTPKLDTPARRVALAVGVSLLLHGLLLYGPDVELPHFKSSLPPLEASLEVLPSPPPAPKPRPRPRKPKPHKAPPPPAPQAPATEPPRAADAAASEGAAASAPPAAETLAQAEAERPPLPRRAQLIFAVNKGTGDFKIGEMMHSLEIDDGHYVLRSETQTVGLAKFFKTYQITQYSSGSYSRQGLQPEQFFEQRADKLSTQRYTAEFDRAAQLARFSDGSEVTLPPDTQDILSVLYQFPPLTHTEEVNIAVSNGKKIERYEFEVATDEKLHTALGDLNTVHLRKVHQANEEGLEVWLAPEYRLFPVKLRIIERSGEISGEIVITAIHAELEKEAKEDANH